MTLLKKMLLFTTMVEDKFRLEAGGYWDNNYCLCNPIVGGGRRGGVRL